VGLTETAMSSFEATFRIGIIAIAGALLMIYMMRAKQSIQDEKRIKVRWMLLFNRHVPILFGHFAVGAVVTAALIELAAQGAGTGARIVISMGALFFGAGTLNTLVMGTMMEFKRASILREQQRRASRTESK
jgi:hypothetical protein